MSKANLLLILMIASLGIAFMACQGQTSAERPAPTLARLVKLDLEAPSNAKVSELITLKLHLQNITDESLTIYTGEHRLDFVVTDSSGVEVQQRWRGGPIEHVELILPLQPKEVRSHELQWDQRANNCQPPSAFRNCPGDAVPPGSYTVRGIFAARVTDNSPPQETVETKAQKLTIRPR
ncbi:MAG: hypothetical protein FJ320_07930 [SAR202 cluster bacterium]|nr:hypothetical protein [SAR202 cluster bacterium]